MSKVSKILYIITQSELGGAQKYVSDLAQYFHGNSLDITVSSGEQGELMKNMSLSGTKIHIFKHLAREISPIQDILCFFEIYAYIKKERPDIVHLNSSKAGAIGAVAAKLAGIKKVIYTAHGYVFLEPMAKWKKIFYIFAEKFSSLFKDVIICVSNYDKKMGIEYKIAPEKKFVTIHNGIEPIDFVSKEKAREFLSHGDKGQGARDRVIIGTIANFYPTKGLLYLIQSAKKIVEKFPDTLFVIIGDGEERKALENEIAKLGLEKNIMLTGKIDDASKYLLALDIYISSSVKEGFPYSILEAMSAGLPIVSTNVGGIPEMLKDNAGILVEPKNPQALADAMQKLLENQDLKHLFGENAKKLIQSEFSKKAMLSKIEDAYSRD